MHRRISSILSALRQDLAARLGDDVILAACRTAGHTWCDSALLTPAAIAFPRPEPFLVPQEPFLVPRAFPRPEPFLVQEPFLVPGGDAVAGL